MRPRPDRWESGSEFPQPAADELDGAPAYPWGAGGALFGSGRQALYAALAAGRGWRRLWAPSYFCPSVVAALAPVGLPVRRYADAPDRPRRLDDVPFETGDVLLLVNTLGLRGRPELTALPEDVAVIEDHTHDPLSPWAFGSTAEVCVASLRKWLPLADGGVAWSPRGRVIAAPAERAAWRRIADDKRVAMERKAAYLAGDDVDKDDYLQRSRAAERALERAAPAAISAWSRAILERCPAARFRAIRAANFERLRAALVAAGVEVLTPTQPGCCPFAVTLVLPSAALRERLSAFLIARRVYPAVLWPMAPGEARDADVALSRRVLSIHCDHRYDEDDLDRIAALVREGLATLESLARASP